ncbi:MAG: hypothetical protein QOI36_465 [Pseudonocardiales bacterium]|jgi:hypothetical protein|nr:hypothetical protein [Pseudonocardiales bacterium]
MLVRFPSRFVLASSVLGVLAASSSAALTMTGGTADAAVKVPEFDNSAAPSVPARATAPLTDAPPVTGAQIAGLAVTPALDRVAAIIAERAQAAAAAEAAKAEAAKQAARAAAPQPAPERSSRDEEFRKLAAQIQQACDDGRLHGRICHE